MIDVNDHIRAKLRQARENAGLSQRQLADLVNSAQGTISDLERGRIRINAADLVRFAEVLDKSVSYFYPGTEESDLTEREQVLVRLLRRLPENWQDSIIDQVKTQVALHEATTGASRAENEIMELPEEEREDAAYKTFFRWLVPLMRVGVRFYVDDDGTTSVGHKLAPGLRIPMPGQDERDRKIMLEMQRRFDLEQFEKKD